MNATLRRAAVLLGLLLLVAPFASAQGPRRITVGVEPAYLFADEGAEEVHVLALGLDTNFDGILDTAAGDVPGQWYVIDAATETVVDSVIFNGFFNNFPIRPGIDELRHHLYLPIDSNVVVYDYQTRSIVPSAFPTELIDTMPVAIYTDAAARLAILSLRAGTNGSVVGVDLARQSWAFTAPAATYPGQSIRSEGRIDSVWEYYTLNEGSGSAPDATLSYTSYSDRAYELANDRPLGGGASEIAVSGELAALVLNGGRRVHVVNTRTMSDLDWSPAILANATSQGASGPRTAAFVGDSVLLVGAANGWLYRLRLTDGSIIDSINLAHRIDRIAVKDSLAFLALPTRVGAGNPADTIVGIVSLRSGTFVDSIPVTGQPIDLFFDSIGDLHIIGKTNGGVVWQVLDGVLFNEVDRLAIRGTVVDPFRVAYDAASDSLFMVVSDTLRGYDLLFPEADGPAIATGRDSLFIQDVAVEGRHLIITRAGQMGSGRQGRVSIYDRDFDTLAAEYATPTRPVASAAGMTFRPGVPVFMTLGRGAEGLQRSDLTVFSYRASVLEPGDTLGRTANHLAYDDRSVGITMNGSHEVVGFDLRNWGNSDINLPTGTTGFDGPRESIIVDEAYVVTTAYDGQLHIFLPDSTYAVPVTTGKLEGITRLGSRLFVAEPLTASYGAESTVWVFDLESLVASVTRESGVAGALRLEQNSPNPARETTTIRFAVDRPGHVRLMLHTADGRELAPLVDETMEQGSYSVSLRTGELASGTYFYTFQIGTERVTRTLQVVR